MNPLPAVCWIGEYPRGCVGDECIRGENYAKVRLYVVLLPILLCIITITVSMMMLYLHVRKLENVVHSYSNRWTRNLSGRKSKRVFRQALLYICAFLCVWVPFIVQSIIVKIYFDDAVIMFYTLLFCNILLYVNYFQHTYHAYQCRLIFSLFVNFCLPSDYIKTVLYKDYGMH